jgi:hypothetical protein
LKDDGNLYPEVYNLLRELPNEALNFSLHKERHPLAIYNRSLIRLQKSFFNILDILGVLDKDPEKIEEQFDRLLEWQKELLYSLQSHMDDCYKILKVTSPLDDKITTKRTEVWLTKSKHPSYAYFSENIKEYRDHIGLIVNKIKHHQARLRKVTIERGYNLHGYYIEGTDLSREGEIMSCPDREIHPNSTAFSFSRDLCYHFYKIYEISFYLKKSLIKAFKNLYNIEINDLSYCKDENKSFGSIAKKIENINLDFFPDEYDKLIPLISLTESGNNEVLTMKMDKLWFKPIPYNFSLYFYLEMDGVTEYVEQPYMTYHFEKYRGNIENIKIIKPEDMGD